MNIQISSTSSNSGENHYSFLSKKVNTPSEARSLQEISEKKLESSASLPSLSPEVPPSVDKIEIVHEAGANILKKSEAAAEARKAEEEVALSEKLENQTKYVDLATKVLEDAIEEGLGTTVLGPADVELAKSGLEVTPELLETGAKTLKIFDADQVIEKAKAELNSKQQEMERLKNQLALKIKKGEDKNQIELLQISVIDLTKEIGLLKDKIKELEEEKGNLIQNLAAILVKTGLITAKGATDHAVQIQETAEALGKGVHSAQETLPIVSHTMGGFLGLIKLALSANEIQANWSLSKKIEEEKKLVLRELEIHKNDPCMKEFLELRIRSLDRQYEVNLVNTVKNYMSVSSGIIGSVFAVKSAIAATIGVTAGSASVTGGLVLLTIGYAPLVLGIGYLALKNQKAIEAKYEKAKLAREIFFTEREIKQLREKQQIIELKLAKAKKTPEEDLEKMNSPHEDRVAAIEKALAELKAKKKALQESNDSGFFDKMANAGDLFFINLLTDSNERNLKNLKNEKENVSLKEMEKRKISIQNIPKFETEKNRIIILIAQKMEKLKNLTNQQKQIDDLNKYGQHVAKFAKGNDGAEMSYLQLAEAHNRLFHLASQNPETLEKMRKFLSDQNLRLKNDMDITPLVKGIDKENFWNYVVMGATAQIK